MQNTEIERKFLVKAEACDEQVLRRLAVRSHEIEQGYLCKDPDKTIRVRIQDRQAFLTIKSGKLRDGLARFEWEREIGLSDAQELIRLCLPGVLHKTRYIIPAASYKGAERKWEVDVFHGRKAGLWLAEIELGEEQEPFERPEWLGEEVTGQPQYYNANM